MTVQPVYTPRKGSPPNPEEMLTSIRGDLRTKATGYSHEMLTSAQTGFPKESGRTAASMRSGVREVAGGFDVQLSAGAPGQDGERAHVVRFLEGGTGRRGPRGQTIPKDRRGFIPSANLRPKGRGQRPQKAWTKAVRRARKVLPQALADMERAWHESLRKAVR